MSQRSLSSYQRDGGPLNACVCVWAGADCLCQCGLCVFVCLCLCIVTAKWAIMCVRSRLSFIHIHMLELGIC